jgi:hypothetical protein
MMVLVVPMSEPRLHMAMVIKAQLLFLHLLRHVPLLEMIR